MKIAWITSWDRVCGIGDYSKILWPEVSRKLTDRGHEGILISIDEHPPVRRLMKRLVELKPDVIHFQHDYGLYGGKTPPLYQFPGLVKKIRSALPRTRVMATAHSVLNEDYRFSVLSKGWQ